MNGIVQDVRYALRQLRGSPGFAAIAVLTIALGVGATVAMFSVVNAVLLRPLPFRDPNGLMAIGEYDTRHGNPGNAIGNVSYPIFVDIRDRNQSFAAIAAYDWTEGTLTGVRAMILRRGTILTLAGTVLGLAGALALAGLIESMLYQTPPCDPLTYVCVCVLLALVAVTASYVPAIRATKVDPMVALRYE
jgi:hypothetical protein